MQYSVISEIYAHICLCKNIWFVGWLVGRVLWHINYRELFNAKSSFYMWFLCKRFLENILKQARDQLFAHSYMVLRIAIKYY